MFYFTLSPVHIRTVIPAVLHFLIASGISGRKGSLIPAIHISTRSFSKTDSDKLLKSLVYGISLYDKAKVLKDLLAYLKIMSFLMISFF